MNEGVILISGEGIQFVYQVEGAFRSGLNFTISAVDYICGNSTHCLCEDPML